ncbi:MAG TPA: PsbP-related protein, partial [Patescibacteria group bacterium]|nr:PsbP-related protein [Patescibacteria group bacterium]
MKKVIIFSLLFVLSACSYDSSKVKTIVSQVKNDGVEHLKKELKLWTQKEEEQAPEQEVKNTPETKQYINEKIGFSFSYPGDIVLGQEVQTDTFVLDVKIKNIETDNVQGLSRDDLLIMSRNIEKGEFGDVSGWTLDNSKKIYRINDKIVEEGVVFSKVGVCSVVFERNLVFFEGNNLINIKLIADSSDIINENSTFFRSDKTNCGDSQVWIFARQGEFYSNLLQNKIGGTAQAWFNSFESIKNSLKIEESLEKTGLSQSVNIKQVNLSPGESGLKLIWPEISGIKQEEAYKKIVESLDFVENTGKTL